MKVIVDTYNALHITGIMPPELAGLDPPGLVQVLARGRWARNQVLLVCDGTQPAGQQATHHGGIRTLYAGAGCEADDLIEQLIERSTAPTRLLVVSSDRRIQKAARRRRCHTMTSDAFLTSIAHDHERGEHQPPKSSPQRPQGKLSSKAVNEWRSTFGINEQDLTEFSELAHNPSPPASEKKSRTTPSPEPRRKTRQPADNPLPEDIIAEAMRMLEED